MVELFLFHPNIAPKKFPEGIKQNFHQGNTLKTLLVGVLIYFNSTYIIQAFTSGQFPTSLCTRAPCMLCSLGTLLMSIAKLHHWQEL